MTQTESTYYHCYATANDTSLYYRDYQNLLRIAQVYSGVEHLKLYIAISTAKPLNYFDKLFVRLITQLFKRHPNVTLQKIFFKTNVGRDFSSFALIRHLIDMENPKANYLFFQNRSGWGPFKANWLQAFQEQFEKYKSTALCGSTINFNDHPLNSNRTDIPHVQTYAFLTHKTYLDMLGDDFPGIKQTSRLDAISKGEIALSQFFLDKGLGITCMEWPEDFITQGTRPKSLGDVRGSVTQNHAFYHKVYFKTESRLRKGFSYFKVLICLMAYAIKLKKGVVR